MAVKTKNVVLQHVYKRQTQRKKQQGDMDYKELFLVKNESP